MEIKINGDIGDISAMLVSAERYALGRKTYIVQWTCNFIANNLNLITKKDKEVMIRDIKNYGELDVRDIDEYQWKRLLGILEGRITNGN